MLFFNFFLSILISIIPPTKFICDGYELNAKIYNALHEQKEIVKDIEKLEQDSFVLLEWKDYEISIPITSYGALDFTNRFWRWSYVNEEGTNLMQPSLSRQYPTGKVVTYSCKAAG